MSTPVSSPAADRDSGPERLGLIAWWRQLHRAAPGYFRWMLGFGLAANLLLLVAPVYMLQVYDRILTSGSQDTLVWITVIALFLLGIYGAAEAGRRRTSALAGLALEAEGSPRAFERLERSGGEGRAGLQADLAALRQVRTLFQNGVLLPFFDLPFVPLFLVILFVIHPVLGVLGLVGAALVSTVAVVAELTTRDASAVASAAHAEAADFAAGLGRQRSAVVAMGLVPRALARWRRVAGVGDRFGLVAARRDGSFAAAARALRQVLQILILGAGAVLALSQEISAGAIVAGSIILTRALAPIDQIVGAWRSIVQARSAWAALQTRLAEVEPAGDFTPLPRPYATLRLERLAVITPGAQAPLIRPFSYSMSAGQAIALVGANGAGKTTLLQTLAGAWPPGGGSVALGGRDVHAWPSADRGRYIGYVPQDVELLPATVAENIARMSDAEEADVFEAARRAGAHDMILALPDGYDTRVGPGGMHLSAGQAQLIGLARALFGEPVLLLLDEPTANLDPQAVAALVRALTAVVERGAMVIAATHDLRLIRELSMVLIIRHGAVMSAPAAEYLKAVEQSARARVSSTSGAVA